MAGRLLLLLDLGDEGLQGLLPLDQHVPDRVVQNRQVASVMLSLQFHELHVPRDLILCRDKLL